MSKGLKSIGKGFKKLFKNKIVKWIVIAAVVFFTGGLAAGAFGGAGAAASFTAAVSSIPVVGGVAGSIAAAGGAAGVALAGAATTALGLGEGAAAGAAAGAEGAAAAGFVESSTGLLVPASEAAGAGAVGAAEVAGGAELLAGGAAEVGAGAAEAGLGGLDAIQAGENVGSALNSSGGLDPTSATNMGIDGWTAPTESGFSSAPGTTPAPNAPAPAPNAPAGTGTGTGAGTGTGTGTGTANTPPPSTQDSLVKFAKEQGKNMMISQAAQMAAGAYNSKQAADEAKRQKEEDARLRRGAPELTNQQLTQLFQQRDPGTYNQPESVRSLIAAVRAGKAG